MNNSHFSLLETMLYEPEHGILLLKQHLERLNRAVIYFHQKVNDHQSARIRLLWHRDSRASIEVIPIQSSSHTLIDVPLHVVLASQPIDCSDTSFLCHKTTRREVYDEARQQHGVDPHNPDAPFDVILWNTNGDITETTIANIAVENLLPGTFRADLLDRGEIIEAVLPKKISSKQSR
ncbi:aminotransferase [Syncephalis plumigaleata]|nr:aminotransferase [Syncephalis plumigaleata]